MQIVKSDSPYLPWLVCLTASLFFFYEFIQMQLFNALSTDLMRAFDLNAKQLGYLSATYLLADVLFLFPAGLLLDRVSTRKVILFAMFLCVISTALFALSTSALLVGICHFIAGIGNALCFLSCLRLASRWFPVTRMALIVGLIVTVGMFGGLMAQTPLVLLNAAVGWRQALLWIAALGVPITFLIWKYVHDYPEHYKEQHLIQQQTLQSTGLVKGIRLAFSNSQNWYGGIYTSFLNLPIMLLGALWGNLYLTQVELVSLKEASYIISMVFWGTIIGSPIVGRLSDNMRQRRKPMIIFALLSILVVLLLVSVRGLGFWPLMLIFFVLGFFTSAQILSYPMIAESNPKMLTSAGTGLASVLIMGGGAVFQPVFGWVMDKYWLGQIAENVRTYPIEAYQAAMLILPAAFIIALVMAWCSKETHCKAMD